MVDRLAGTKGVTGGELRDGGGFGRIWGFGLWWFSVEAEGLGGPARPSGVGWWHWTDGGGPARDELSQRVAAAKLTGGEEEGFPPSLAGRGAH